MFAHRHRVKCTPSIKLGENTIQKQNLVKLPDISFPRFHYPHFLPPPNFPQLKVPQSLWLWAVALLWCHVKNVFNIKTNVEAEYKLVRNNTKYALGETAFIGRDLFSPEKDRH